MKALSKLNYLNVPAFGSIFLLAFALLSLSLSTTASAFEVHVFLKDHLGNVTTITDQQGNVLQRNVITPYGEISRMTDGAGNEIPIEQSRSERLFTGHYYDRESGLYYMNARYYDVASKRFASLDPSYYGNSPGKAFSNAEGSTMASNAMMYVEGRATTSVDPTGLGQFNINVTWIRQPKPRTSFSSGMGGRDYTGRGGTVFKRGTRDSRLTSPSHGSLAPGSAGVSASQGGDAGAQQPSNYEGAGNDVGSFIEIWTAFSGLKAVRAATGWAAAKIAARRLASSRQAYVSQAGQLSQLGAELRASGASPEHIARTLHAARRELGVRFKDLTPAAERGVIYERNLRVYGDRLGPTVDWLRAQGRSWDQIIESAARTGGKDLGL